MLKSLVCRLAEFEQPWFGYWARLLDVDTPHLPLAERNIHRKVWEWVCIAQALHERGVLRPGAKGLGFAVGRERLPALFASCGAEVVATDVGDPVVAENWRASGEYEGRVDGLFFADLLSREAFDRLVSYRHVDMRDLSGFAPESVDFAWSACSMEHLGTLEAGIEFVMASTRLLRLGGVAVHTTEYNLSSVDATVEAGETVIYRCSDLERLDARLRGIGAGLTTLDLDPGTHEYDIKYDYEPYHRNGRRHLKLRLAGYVSTSVLLIVQN